MTFLPRPGVRTPTSGNKKYYFDKGLPSLQIYDFS